MQEMVTARLEESAEGPARKYYKLTDKGKETLALMEHYYHMLLKGVETLRDRKERS